MVCCSSCSKDVRACEYDTHKCGQHDLQQLRVAAEVVHQLFCNTASNIVHLPTAGTVCSIYNHNYIIIL